MTLFQDNSQCQSILLLFFFTFCMLVFCMSFFFKFKLKNKVEFVKLSSKQMVLEERKFVFWKPHVINGKWIFHSYYYVRRVGMIQ